MCGRPNPETNEVCQFCSARIKPLIVGSAETPSTPASMAASDADAQSTDDWLATIRKDATPVTGLLPDISEEEASDWLGRLRAQHPPEEPRFPLPKVEPEPPPPPEPSPLKRSSTDLLRSQAAAASAASAEPEPTPAEPQVPDWLASIRRAQQAGGSEPEETLSVEPEAPSAWEAPPLMSTAPPATPADVDPSSFDFLLNFKPEAPPAESVTEKPAAAPSGLGDLPDWLIAMRPTAAESSAPPPAAPPTPAEPSPKETTPPPVVPAPRPPAPAVPPPGAEIARATLPAWLEAMRPVYVPKLASVSEDREETAGPLAGLRGVLGAEPIVAMPRQAEVRSMTLQVSEAQSALLERLRQPTEEGARQKSAGVRRVTAQLDRWLVTLALVVSIAVPTLLGSRILPAPSGRAPETHAAFMAIDSLAAGTPVLLAFEYGPASIGELDVQVEAVLDHLAAKGARLAAVSSQPEGAALAQAALQRLEAAGYQSGQGYAHLGYIPGGAIGLAHFADQPQTATTGWSRSGASAWDSPALTGIHSLADFSLLVIFAATPEVARPWIEQVGTRAPHMQVIAAVSAGAEALMLPYYESETPSLAGLVTGLNGASGYQPTNETVQARRDSYGFGILATAALIIASSAYHGIKKRKEVDL